MIRIRFLLFPVMCLSLVLFLLGYQYTDYRIIITGIAYLVVLMTATMVSMDGFKNKRRILLYSIIATVPAAIIVSSYFTIDEIIIMIIMILVILGYTYLLLRRLSGWDM